MTILDIILTIPMLYGLVRGLYKGLIQELASIVGLIGGLILAFFFSEALYLKLRVFFENPGIEIRVLSFIIIFILVVIAISLISKMLTKALDAIALGGINHLLGGLFGLGKWFAIMLVVVYFLENLRQQGTFQQDTFQDSFVYQILVDSIVYVAEPLDKIFDLNNTEPPLNLNPSP